MISKRSPREHGAKIMQLRSFLFVPGDSERKLKKAYATNADAIILDLEDSIATERKSNARQFVRAAINAHNNRESKNSKKLFVRINGLVSSEYTNDLKAVVSPGLDGIVLPKVESFEDIEFVAKHLLGLEGPAGVKVRGVSIFALTCETARAVIKLNSFLDVHHRLKYLSWGAEDLRVDLRAANNRSDDGRWTEPFINARNQCLFAARATKSQPIETVFADYANLKGLEVDCLRSKRDGFSGRIAIHPSQIDVINRCYSPSETEIALAKRIISAFQKKPDHGAVGIDGRMYELPNLQAARDLLGKTQAE